MATNRAQFRRGLSSQRSKFDDAEQPEIGRAAYPCTGPSGCECMPHHASGEKGPFGRNVEASTRIRAAGLDTPVVVTGGVHGFAQAEALLAGDLADVVGFARQSLADPDWFVKVRSGHGDQVGVCVYANYCEALDERHEEVTCKLRDRAGLDEPAIRKSKDGKRRLTPPAWTPR